MKLDENLGNSALAVLVAAGHDVSSIPLQQMIGSADRRVADVCRDESRVLVTLDLDFANPFVFDPSRYRGIVVLRPSLRLSMSMILLTLDTFCRAVAAGNDPDGELWIVEPDRLRIFDPRDS